MKYNIKFVLTLLLAILFFQLQAQVDTLVDEVVAQYPTHFSSTKELVNQIEKDFKSDKDKAKAAYAWIAMNIVYDTKAVGKPQRIRFTYRSLAELEAKKKQFRDDLAERTLKKKKALCEGYSTLFQNLCQQMNIECQIIPGTARRQISEIGRQNLPSNHVWNAVKINGKWELIDATWAAGWVDYSKMKFHKEYSPAYFTSSSAEFAMKHFPDDETWLLTNKIKSTADFTAQPLPYKAFLGKNIELIAPKNGTLNFSISSGLQFSFKNIPEGTEIAYHFKRERYGQKVKSYLKANSLSFTIYPELKGRDELIIYFNGEPALGFKVNVE